MRVIADANPLAPLCATWHEGFRQCAPACLDQYERAGQGAGGACLSAAFHPRHAHPCQRQRALRVTDARSVVKDWNIHFLTLPDSCIHGRIGIGCQQNL